MIRALDAGLARGPHRRRISRLHLLLLPMVVIMIYPLLWLVGSSLKPADSVFSGSLLPRSFEWNNYSRGWNAVDLSFGKFFVNSIVLCTVAVIGNLISCSMAGYAFGQLRFRFKKVLFAIMLGSIMLPSNATLIPQYLLFNQLNWTGTILPLVAPKFLAVDAFFIFLVVQFVRSLPAELFEAAVMDGASPLRIYWTIVLPLIKPALVTTAIFTFIWVWNDFFTQLIYLTSPDQYTVPLGLRLFLDATGGSQYGPMFAMATLALIPVTVVFVIFQRFIVEGVVTTGIKG